MKKIQFVYFDVGGVMNDWSDYFRTATKKFGINYEDFNEFWNTDNIWDDITIGKISPQDVWNLAIKKFNIKDANDYNFVESWMSDYKPRLEIHDLAKQLSKKYKIGLISNLYKGMIPRLIEIGNVANVDYSAIVLSYETGLDKSEKEIFKIATEKAGVKPEEIFYIDDRKDFLENAKSLGWKTFWFDEKHVSDSVNKIKEVLL